MKQYSFLIIIFLYSLSIYSQNHSERSIDLLLSDTILKKTNMRNVSLIDNMCITGSRYILLSNKDSLYFLGYGGYLSYKPKGGKISAFCVSDNNIYYTAHNHVYQINSQKGEELITHLPFTPLNMWGGQNIIYVSTLEKNKFFLYAIHPINGKVKQLFHVNNKIVSVLEYYTHIYVFTSKGLIMVDSENGFYTKIPFPKDTVKEINSASINKDNGSIFISCTDGVYMFYQQKLHKLCSEKGTLCFDKDGIVLFNAPNHFLIRLRNNLIYQYPKEIIIDIK